MEYCRAHKGRRKTLNGFVGSSVCKASVSSYTKYRYLCEFFENLIDRTITDLWQNCEKKIITFVEDIDFRKSNGFTPVVVTRCSYLDCRKLYDSLFQSRDVQLIDASFLTTSIVSLVDSIRNASRKGPACVVLNSLECIPSTYIDNIISVISDRDLKLNTVLLITVSTDVSIIYDHCSKETCSRLHIKSFEFPSPSEVAIEVLNKLALHCEYDEQTRINGSLFCFLKKRFFDYNFSMDELKKTLKLAVFEHIFNNKGRETENSDSIKLRLQSYLTHLRLLFELSPYSSSAFDSIDELHCEIQQNPDFFSFKNGVFADWLVCIVSLPEEDILRILRQTLPVVIKSSPHLGSEVKGVITDFDNANSKSLNISLHNDEDVELNKEEIQQCRYKSITPKSPRLSHHQMQQQMRKKMEIDKQSDSLRSSRQKLASLFCQVFASALTPFELWNELENNLIDKGMDIIQRIYPCTGETFETVMIYQTQNKDYEHFDLCKAYIALVMLSCDGKTVSLDEWANNFVCKLQPISDIDSLSRFFRSVGELELMGLLKQCGDRKFSISSTYVPFKKLIAFS